MLAPGTLHQSSDTLEWPEVRLEGPRHLVLLSDYVVEWEADGFPRQRLIVPAGYEFDGASIPAVLEWYLGRDYILPAAVPHDWQYGFAGRIPADSHLYRDETGEWVEAGHAWSRKEADRFFARNLRFCDISDGQRRNAYRGVRIGGWIAWRKAKRRAALRKLTPAVQ